jgi:hypothetical protein
MLLDAARMRRRGRLLDHSEVSGRRAQGSPDYEAGVAR